MKQKLNGGITVFILIAALGAIIYYGYKNFLADPPTISPEETRRMMGGGGGGGMAPAPTATVPGSEAGAKGDAAGKGDAGSKDDAKADDGKGSAK